MSILKTLFIGRPASGKGTHSKQLVKYGPKYIGTGDLIRAARKRKDRKITPYGDRLDAGGFLPDLELFYLVNKELATLDLSRGYVLDGAVRNVAQVKEALKRNLLEEVVFLNVSEEIALRRIRLRYIKDGRKEDAPESAVKRMREYTEKTEPALLELMARGLKIFPIDGNRQVDVVHEEIMTSLGLK